MWSDELDNKMRETTEGSQPAYDERAWRKMEELLDKHLPQKRRRRIIPLLLLPLALIGTGVFFALQRQSGNNITTENNKASQSITSGDEVLNSKEKDATLIAPSPDELAQRTDPSEVEIKDVAVTITPNKPVVNSQATSGQKRATGKNIVSQPLGRPGKSTTVEGNRHTLNDQQKEIPEETAVTTKSSESSTTTPVKAITGNTAGNEKKNVNQAQVDDPSTKSPSKTRDSRGSNFAITVSTGPDLSSINFNEPGQWRMQYGVGVLYSLSEKISLRTGFFVGRKIYTADPDDYHSNYNPPPSLQKIEANCLVYEIPLNVLYSFPKSKKHNWFVGGGLSSYLMKEETYDYLYKYPNGQVQYHTLEYKNKNAHFFSVADLSGGYQYHFSDRFSLMAEPYVKIPLSGVGQGKVQLNSGGILFTGVFKLFFKKN